MDNYALQVQQAKQRFLTYDQERIIGKMGLEANEEYIYVNLLCQQYRIHRVSANFEKWEDGWVSGNSHGEVMTLLDILCDSAPDRCLTGRWTSTQSLGRMFHRQLLEQKDPLAQRIDGQVEAFHFACRALGGMPISGADAGYAFCLCCDLPVAVQFWHSDEDFGPKLHLMWDENTLQYIRYETTWFAAGLLRQRIAQWMDRYPDSK